MRLPSLPSADWRAWVALVFGILGGVAMTTFAVWLVWVLAFSGVWADDTQKQRIIYLGTGLIVLLLGSVSSLLSLGFAINSRKMAIKTPGGAEFSLEGGTPDPGTTLQTTTKTIENTGVVKS